MAKGEDRDRQLEAQWRRIFRQHFKSGLNIRDFCRRGSLRESAFYFWRRELQRRGVDRSDEEQEQRKRRVRVMFMSTHRQERPQLRSSGHGPGGRNMRDWT